MFFLFLFIHIISVDSLLKSQDLDPDVVLDQLERLERNIEDLQKVRIEKNLTSGYISRNEKRFDEVETEIQTNFGSLEEFQNRIENLEEKIEIFNQTYDMRFNELFDEILSLKSLIGNSGNKDVKRGTLDDDVKTELQDNDLGYVKNNTLDSSEIDVKSRYENSIKLLWSNSYDEALSELIELREIEPPDLMPNIQYWIGEVYYAKKEFNQAVIEFGEGLKKFPDSIKGPDNMLKLGLSFSNMKKSFEACNVLIELEIKYPDASKNVLQRTEKEKKKLNCKD